jgi:hypothetical protein
MKKAKEPGDFMSKAADLLSIFRNLTANKKDETSLSSEKPALKTETNQNPADNYAGPQSVPHLTPFDSKTNIFESIIEKHEKTVKKIMKNQNKEKDANK